MEEKVEEKSVKIKLNPWKILTVIILILVIANLYFTYNISTTITGGFIQTESGTQEQPQTAPSTNPTPTQPTRPSQPTQPSPTQVSVDDDPVKGPSDAKVTIVEFSEFQCPFCARVQPTVNQILEEYGDDVRIVYRDFPLSFHQYAQKAAEAAECADDQGKFWEYHDKLFENQQALDTSNLKQYAKDLGLDSAQFDSCLDSGKYELEVKKDFQDGQSYGVSGTPTFFINGIKVVGAQPFSTFKQVIDSELTK